MSINLCPHCNQRYLVQPHNTTYLHNCNIPIAPVAKRKDDIVEIGAWTDFTGSGGKSINAVAWKGVENKLWGTDAAILGNKVQTVTVRGKSTKIFRSRTHLEYIENADQVAPPSDGSEEII